MPNFDPAQELPDDQTVVQVPISLPNQFGGVAVGAPTDIDPGAAAAAAARGEGFQSFPGITAPPIAPPAPTSPPPLALVPPPPAGPIAPDPTAPAPPAGRARPGAAPPPAGADPIGELMLAATAPPDAGGDAVDRELAAARQPAAAKPGDMAAGAGRVDAAAAEHEAALKRQGEVDAANAAREAEAKQRAADEAARRLEVQQKAQAESDRAIQAAREAAQKQPYHSYWQDRSVGQRVMAMIGIMLGGVSWERNHRNEAADTMDRLIAQDFERQKEQHAELWKGVETAMQQGQALRANQLAEMSQFRLNQGLQLEAIIAKGNELAAHAKNEVGLAALRDQNAKLGFARDQAIEEARRLDAAAREHAHYQNEELKIQRGHLAVSAAAGRRAAAADQDDRVIKLAKRAFPGSTEALKAVKARDEAEGLVEELKKNPTALAQSLATERLASVFGGGGKPSVAVLHMVDPNATSWAGLAQDKISKALTGKSGDMIRKNLLRMAEDERAHAQDMVEKHRAKGSSALKGLAKHAPDATENYLNGIFGEPRAAAAAGPSLRPDQVEALKRVPKTDPQYRRAQELLSAQQ